MKHNFLANFIFIGIVAQSHLGFAQTAQLTSTQTPISRGEVVNKIDQLTEMRVQLASTLLNVTDRNQITEETFKQVCQPVGLSLKAWVESDQAKQQGIKAKQISERYRNKNNKPEDFEKKALREMYFNKDLVWKIEKEKLDGVDGFRMYRRIDTHTSCKSCHGSREQRPQFVLDKYPEDKAFGFPKDSLRGAFSIWIKGT